RSLFALIPPVTERKNLAFLPRPSGPRGRARPLACGAAVLFFGRLAELVLRSRSLAGSPAVLFCVHPVARRQDDDPRDRLIDSRQPLTFQAPELRSLRAPSSDRTERRPDPIVGVQLLMSFHIRADVSLPRTG